MIKSKKFPSQKTTIGEHIEENYRSEDSFLIPHHSVDKRPADVSVYVRFVQGFHDYSKKLKFIFHHLVQSTSEHT